MRRATPRDEGAAAVEFALVSILLFTLLFGIVQYGYGFFQLQGAFATTRDAARRASIGVETCSDVSGPTNWPSIVRNAAAGNGFSASITNATLTFTHADSTNVNPAPQRGDTLTVQVTYTPGLQLPLVPYPSSITRTASTTVEDPGNIPSTTGCSWTP